MRFSMTVLMRAASLIMVVAAAALKPLPAQQHQHRPDAQRHDVMAMHCGSTSELMQGHHAGQPHDARAQGMMHGLMNMMGPPSPAMILHRRNELALTTAQASRLEALQQEAQTACRQHITLAMTAHHDANELLESVAPDYAAFEAKLKEATSHMVAAHVAMAKAAVAAREALTPEQRARLKNLMQEMPKQQER